MNKLKSLSLVALAALGLSAYGGTTTNEWWNVTLEDDSFQDGFPGLTIGELGTLTNDEDKAQCVQPYAEGVWEMIEGDESYVTNGIVTNFVNGAMAEVADSVYLKLDTQGNDLTWTADTTDVSNNIVALVDADLFLVGSDSAPDATDFDSDGDVHTAVYLKNETDEDSGETTNSVLCVYVYNGGTGVREWQELDGVEVEDNAWAHVQVMVDYADESNPMVQVFVNGTQMHARGGSAVSWTAAIKGSSKDAFKLSSVAFRGTGAVDNFVGTTHVVSVDTFNFVAEVYMDNEPVAQGQAGNVSRTVSADVGKNATFTGFSFHDYVEGSQEATFALKRIEFINQGNGAVTTIDYTYQDHQMTPDNSPAVAFDKSYKEIEDPETGDIIQGEEYQSGTFTVLAPTTGATSNSVIARVYFETIGAFNANAETVIEGNATTNSVLVKPADCPMDLAWTFPATTNGAILSTVQVYEGAAFAYANGTATVSTNLAAALAADTLFVTATYTNGTLAAGQTLQPDAGVNGLYTFTVVEGGQVTPPEVDVGEGLAGYNAQHPDAPVQPIAFAVPEGGQDELCSLAFVAPEDGWYFLYTSTTVAGPYLPDYATKKQVSKNDLVTLTESAAGTTKFFKIGWSETEPSAE